MKGIIVDDEPKGREVLRTLLERNCPEIQVAGTATNVAEARALIEKVNPDVVFLDVEMPGGNGFRLLDEIETRNFEIIFVTSYGHYAIPALRYSATDYLLKPVDISELRQAVDRLIEKVAEGRHTKTAYRLLSSNLAQPPAHQKLAIHGVNEIKFAPLTEIVRLEGDSNYTYIFTAAGEKFHSSRTLKDYEDILSSLHNFIRVHKTHLVNADHISSFIKADGGYIIMSDGSQVEVSRRKKQELIERLGLA
jgi:two-component system LytT family response regulator